MNRFRNFTSPIHPIGFGNVWVRALDDKRSFLDTLREGIQPVQGFPPVHLLLTSLCRDCLSRCEYMIPRRK